MQGEYHISDIAVELEACNLLPAIIFRTSRSQCDIDVQRAATNRRLGLPVMRQREIREIVNEITRSYDFDVELIRSHPHYNSLIRTGIGAHHAGQLLMWRLLLEELMAAGVMKILVATGTVAAGVDFPARTVVITAHSRRGSGGYKNLSSAEFQQMSGRAGRRGKDSVGFCVAAPSAYCDARELLKISKKPPEPLVSAYFPSPSTVLNLLRYRNVDDLRFTVERSLAAYVDRKNAKNIRTEIEGHEQRLLQLGGGAEEASDEDETTSNDKRKKERSKLRKKINRFKNQANELEEKQQQMLERTLIGLRTLGHLENFSLSEKGYCSANLCTNLVLELAEIIEGGLLDGASAEKMAAIISSICGDEHRQYLKSKDSSLSKEEIASLSEIIKRVKELAIPGVPADRMVITNAAFTVLTWLRAESWQEFRGLLNLSGAQEGDAARLINQTAEHLNQITRLTQTHPQLALRAEEAKRRILRPPLTEAINLE